MKKRPQPLLIVLGALLVAAIVGVVLTRDTGAPPRSSRRGPSQVWQRWRKLVDQQPLRTAQAVTAGATEPEERRLGYRALRLADDEVDLAFASALREAEFHPAPATDEVKAVQAHIHEVEGKVKADQAQVAQLKAKAERSGDPEAQADLELATAQMALDQEELADSQQDLMRAGGDVHGIIKRLLDEHEASHAAIQTQQPQAQPIQESWTLASHVGAWRTVQSRQGQVKAAEAEATAAATELGKGHDELEARVAQQKNAKPAPGADRAAMLEAVRAQAADAKTLSEFDKRVQDEQELADTYREWESVLGSRQMRSLHGLLEDLVLILVICLLAAGANQFIHRMDAALPSDQRTRKSAHFIARFVLQVVVLLLILLVVVGAPGQVTTVLGLAGAGLTVALKDFIVAFFGWFVLMGRNGVRVGDWVEINGIGGEVVEIGLLRTVLLETGKWSDAGHPTGRKVAFVNSYAIEGHFFNFSTSGQWLWDELEVLVPAGEDPYPIVKAIQELATKETEANARQAEQEWQRVASSVALQAFSAAPALDVRPTNLGVVIVVRYITRAPERYDLRNRLYSRIVELLRSRNIAPVAT